MVGRAVCEGLDGVLCRQGVGFGYGGELGGEVGDAVGFCAEGGFAVGLR